MAVRLDDRREVQRVRVDDALALGDGGALVNEHERLRGIICGVALRGAAEVARGVLVPRVGAPGKIHDSCSRRESRSCSHATGRHVSIDDNDRLLLGGLVVVVGQQGAYSQGVRRSCGRRLHQVADAPGSLARGKQERRVVERIPRQGVECRHVGYGRQQVSVLVQRRGIDCGPASRRRRR